MPNATVTILRENPDGTEFLTVVVDERYEEVVNAYDEGDNPIALTPDEERFAVRMVRMGLFDDED